MMAAMNFHLRLCLASYRIWQENLLPLSSKQGFVTRFQRHTNSDLLRCKALAKVVIGFFCLCLLFSRLLP